MLNNALVLQARMSNLAWRAVQELDTMEDVMNVLKSDNVGISSSLINLITSLNSLVTATRDIADVSSYSSSLSSGSWGNQLHPPAKAAIGAVCIAFKVSAGVVEKAYGIVQ